VTGKYVIPGGTDPHTHLDFPFGGTASIVDCAVQQRDRALSEALETWHAKAEGKVAIDYGFHMIVLGLQDSRVPELEEMVRQDVTSFNCLWPILVLSWWTILPSSRP
jgi:dihydropyrimidinase